MESKRFFAKHPRGGGRQNLRGFQKFLGGKRLLGEGKVLLGGPAVESQTLSQPSRLNLDKFGVDNYIPDCRSAPFALTIGPLA